MGCQAINLSKTLLLYNYCNIGTRGFIHIKLRYSLPISGGQLSCEKLDKHMKYVVVKLFRYAIICTNTYMTLSHRKADHLRLAGCTIILWVCTNNSILVLQHCFWQVYGLTWLDIPWHVPKWLAYWKPAQTAPVRKLFTNDMMSCTWYIHVCTYWGIVYYTIHSTVYTNICIYWFHLNHNRISW